jgi:predicted Rossmann fold nucleotide-binding protein DprA/Smf involved in DNA uptake
VDDLLRLWPIIASVVGAFAAWTMTLAIATWSLAKYINGKVETVTGRIDADFKVINAKLIEQDAKRIELKEAILLEVRQRAHTLQGRMDMQHTATDERINDLKDKMVEELGELGTRVTRVEGWIENVDHDRKRLRN